MWEIWTAEDGMEIGRDGDTHQSEKSWDKVTVFFRIRFLPPALQFLDFGFYFF